MRLLPLLLGAAILEAVAAQNLLVPTTTTTATTTTTLATTANTIGVSLTSTTAVGTLSSSTASLTTSAATVSTARLITNARVTPTTRPPVTRAPTPVRRTPDPATKVIRRLQYIDVDLLLSNKRIMSCYVRCFVGKGPCTPEARDFRKLLPRILATGCGSCTPNERKVIKKLFLFMYKERFSDWKLLQVRFDPKCKFESKVLGFMGVQAKKPTAPYKPAIT